MTKNDEVLNKALALAQSSSWQDFSLNELADTLDTTLDELYRQIRSRDDIAELLFDRADTAMLSQSHHAALSQQRADARLAHCLATWFDALRPYRSLVRQILAYKLEPGHFHLQAHGITRISRTVQWFLTAARWRPQGLSRIVTEIGVTSIYLMTFRQYLYDESLTHAKLETRLQKRLRPLAPKD